METLCAGNILSAADLEHLDEYLSAAYFDRYGEQVEPFSRSLASAMKLQQILLLDGFSVMTDTGAGRSTCQIRDTATSVSATAETFAEAMSAAALAWHRVGKAP